MRVCYVSDKNLLKLRNATSYFELNADETKRLPEIIDDLDISCSLLAIVSETDGCVTPVTKGTPDHLSQEDEDKENMRPADTSVASQSRSFDDEVDESGKPLPLGKIANLSIAESGDRIQQLLTTAPWPSVRQLFGMNVERPLPENQARRLLSSVAFELSKTTPDGLVVLLPCSELSFGFTLCRTLCCGLMFDDSIRSLDVRWLQENAFPSQLPELQTLKRRMAGSQLVTREEYRAVFTLAAERSPDGGVHVLVSYTAAWHTSLRLLDFPTSGSMGRLTVRPLVGHSKSAIAFLFDGIQRLKLLATAAEAGYREWPAEGDFEMTAFLQSLLPTFRHLCEPRDAEEVSGLEVSRADGGLDSRWRSLIDRRARDVTEMLWTLLRAVDSQRHLQECLIAILKCIQENNVPVKIDRSNVSELAALLIRISSEGLRCLPAFLNGVSLLIDAGLFSLFNDHRAILEAVFAEHQVDLSALQPLLRSFTDTGVHLRERLERLERLHCACEFAHLLRAHAPHREIAADVKHILTALKDSSADELEFHIPTSNLLPTLRQEMPTSWSVSLELSGRGAVKTKALFKRPAGEAIGKKDTQSKMAKRRRNRRNDVARFTQLQIISKASPIIGERTL